MTEKTDKRVLNFGAGPSALPQAVLEKANAELMNYQNCGMSVMEISHRSSLFQQIIVDAQSKLRHLLDVPQHYKILFLQGGASLQFSMVPFNLFQRKKPVDVFHTGIWAKKAIDVIDRLAASRIIADGSATNFREIPDIDSTDINPNASYVYLVSNNTIMGTQFNRFPDTGNVPLVADMSSDILSQPIDVSQFGLIFAGCQKNIGISGLALVIIREDLMSRYQSVIPDILRYQSHSDANSCYNTPPTFAIYMLNLVLDWIINQGGIGTIAVHNQHKADWLYRYIDKSKFYTAPVSKPDRSRMNVIIRIGQGHNALEEKLVHQADQSGLIGLKGHRSVGGLRASIYNAATVQSVETLTQFLENFADGHR